VPRVQAFHGAPPRRGRPAATIAIVSRSLRKRASAKTPSRLRALPWAALLQAVLAAGQRWRALSDKDRARLTRLVRDSRGRVGNLSSKDRDELRKLVRKLDLRGMGRDVLAPLRGRGRRKRR
jgi:hypothetical protein